MKKSLKIIKQTPCNRLNTRYRKGAMSNDRKSEIDALRRNYLEQIERHEAEIARFKEKLTRLDEFAKDRDNFLISPIDHYRGYGLTDAIIDAVSALHGIGALDCADGVSATQVCSYLKGHGFRPIGPNFTVSVHTTLDRLAERADGRLLVSRESGKKRFSPGRKE
jgi:hypothetical protein